MREGTELTSKTKGTSGLWVEEWSTIPMEIKKYRGMKDLASLLVKYQQVKTYIPTTLFDLPPKWEYLKQKKCPECGNKLLLMKGKPLAYCRGKRHPDRKGFVITLDKLAQILVR